MKAPSHSVYLLPLAVGLMASWGDAAWAFPVWRARISVHTCNITNAATNSGVRVKLNGQNVTHLDKFENDFDRNEWDSYELDLKEISDHGDIGYLQLVKPGSDAWCVDAVRLAINGKWIFRKTFGPKWLNNGTVQTFYRSEIDHSKDGSRWEAAMLGWAANPHRRIHISSYGLREWIEGLAGSFINLSNSPRYNLKWHTTEPTGVRIWKLDSKRFRFRLHLYEQNNDCETNAKFTVKFACTDNKLRMTLEDPNIDFVGLRCSALQLVGEILKGDFEKKFGLDSLESVVDLPIDCPRITVSGSDKSANVRLAW